MAQSNQLPEDSIHPPKLDNPSPSEGLRGVAQSNEQGSEGLAKYLFKNYSLSAGETNRLVHFIERYRKQHELDARVDELISYGREVGLLDSRVKTALHERIEKLKALRAKDK